LSFQFKQFFVRDNQCALKVGTDSVLLGAWSFQHASLNHVLDVGAGSGVLSLMIAQRFPNAFVHALEIDDIAAQQCHENFKKSPFFDRLSLSWTDFRDFKPSIKYDAIICNPPYFTRGSLSSSDDRRNIARQNLCFELGDLFALAKFWLNDESSPVSLIYPAEQAPKIITVALEHGFFLMKQMNISNKKGAKPKRALLQFSRKVDILRKKVFFLKDSSERPTAEYIHLCKDFYLHF
jgi:tRNA1Val (adenine37-N6)-methyltransferase